MFDSKVPPEDLKVLEQIKVTIENRRKFYGDVSVKSFIGNAGRGWSNAITTLTVLPKDVEPKVNGGMNYGDIVYSESIFRPDAFIDFIDKLINQGKLVIPSLPEIQLEGRFFSNPFLGYIQSKDKMFNLDWPSNFYQFEPKDRSINIPTGPYVSLSSPLYPDYTSLFQDKFGLSITHYHQFWGNVLIFLPNYKAKITAMVLGSKQLVVSTIKNIDQKLIAKIFLQDYQNIEKAEIKVTESDTVVPLNFVPDSVHVHLLSSESGEILDYRRLHLSWPAISEDITIEIGTEDILQLINRGEGDQTEFKQDISKNKEGFVETIVAFANTYGGTILVGVDDHGDIVGSYEQKLEETIQNVIRSHCEPPIEVKVENKILNDKNIVVVSVMEGDDKPYTCRGKGIFVRSGSTNRIATRYELDEFYETKENSSPGREQLDMRRHIYKKRKKQLGEEWI